MAKGIKTGGRDFKPGQSGNPAGRPLEHTGQLAYDHFFDVVGNVNAEIEKNKLTGKKIL